MIFFEDNKKVGYEIPEEDQEDYFNEEKKRRFGVDGWQGFIRRY